MRYVLGDDDLRALEVRTFILRRHRCASAHLVNQTMTDPVLEEKDEVR